MAIALSLDSPLSERPDTASSDSHPAATTEKNEKRKTSRRANTAERRATHNAVERQRRETLNGRFLDLAALLPNLASVRRPSKSAIVNSSIAQLHAGRRHRYIAARELRTLYTQFLALKSECDEWRSRAGVAPIGEDCERSGEFRRLVEMDLGGREVKFEEMGEEERGALRMAACAGAGGGGEDKEDDEDGLGDMEEGNAVEEPPITPITPNPATSMHRKASTHVPATMSIPIPSAHHASYYDAAHGYYPPGSAGGYPHSPHGHHHPHHAHGQMVGSLGSDYGMPYHAHGHPMINTNLHSAMVNGGPHTPLYGPHGGGMTPPSLPTIPIHAQSLREFAPHHLSHSVKSEYSIGGMTMNYPGIGSFPGAPFSFDDASSTSNSGGSVDGRGASPASISLPAGSPGAVKTNEESTSSTGGGTAFTNVAMGMFW